jgi:hypothetical protein
MLLQTGMGVAVFVSVLIAVEAGVEVEANLCGVCVGVRNGSLVFKGVAVGINQLWMCTRWY